MRRLIPVLLVCFIPALFGSVSAQTQEEYDALMVILKDTSIDSRIKLGEEFLNKYPQSPYGTNVRQRLAYDYNDKGNWAKVIEHGEPLDIPDGVLQTFLAQAHSERKNDARCIEYAQKAIATLGGPRPANVDEQQWASQKNALLPHAQYLLGLSYANQARRSSGAAKTDLLAKARQTLLAVTRATPKNDAAHMQLGLVLVDMGESDDGIDALARAVVIGGPAKLIAQGELERIYVYYNKSKMGLDKVLAKARGGK